VNSGGVRDDFFDSGVFRMRFMSSVEEQEYANRLKDKELLEYLALRCRESFLEAL